MRTKDTMEPDDNFMTFIKNAWFESLQARKPIAAKQGEKKIDNLPS